MEIPTKTLIGSLIPIKKADFSFSAYSTPSAVVPVNTSNIWPVIDWAFSPVWTPTYTYGAIYLDLGEVKTFNAMAIANLGFASSLSIWISSASNTAYSQPSAQSSVIAGPITPPSTIGPGFNVIIYETPITARYIYIYLQGNTSSIQLAEIALANLIELQYNEQLSSFIRTPGNINSQNFVMQNGRQVKIITGKATDNISASYKWSDDGTLARKIYELSTELANTGSPLLWVPPIKDTSEESIDNRIPEFINLDQIPDVKQTVATIWEMNLRGRCQP